MVVAVVEDHDGLRVALHRLLRTAGYDTALFNSAEAYLAAQPSMPVCVLVDVRLPGMSGIELQRHLRAQPPVPRIILTTADRSLAEHAVELGVDAMLIKPVTREALLSTIASFLQDAARSDRGRSTDRARGPVPKNARDRDLAR